MRMVVWLRLLAVGLLVSIVATACATDRNLAERRLANAHELADLMRQHRWNEGAAALDDGRVTAAEYRHLFDLFRACVVEHGGTVEQVQRNPVSPNMLQYTINPGAGGLKKSEELVNKCQARYMMVDAFMWNTPAPMNPVAAETARKCLRRAGFTVPDSADDVVDFARATNGKRQGLVADCVTDAALKADPGSLGAGYGAPEVF